MKKYDTNKLSRKQMKGVMGGVLQMDCYCLTSHGEPTSTGYGCVTVDGCTATAAEVCSSGQAKCFSVNPS